MKLKGSNNEKIKQASFVLKTLAKIFPDSECHLNFKNPLELLIGTILSAQCTDLRVNKITPHLFQKYLTSTDYAKADLNTLQKEIYSTGFYQNKARNIIASNRVITDKYNGEIPNTMGDLISLPGIGRKSANVLLGNVFNTQGIVVDTHIRRVSNRLGLTDKLDPVKIEFELMEVIPQNEWTDFSHRAGDLGRKICKSRKPLCSSCPLKRRCPSANKFE